MTLTASGSSASVSLSPQGPRRRVRVWDDEVDAIDVGGEVVELVSDHLERRCSLVFMPPDVVRPVEESHARPGDRVGFADAYPVLVATLSSLADLNAHLEERGEAPVPMSRFRPSVVVDGGEPFDEERAAAMRMGSVTLRTPKRCARCRVITVDQATAETSKEPLRTLATYRREANNVYFAMNAIPDIEADEVETIRVGDPVHYLPTGVGS